MSDDNRTLQVSHLVKMTTLAFEATGDAPTRTGLPMPEWLTAAVQHLDDELQDASDKKAFADNLAKEVLAFLVFSRTRNLGVEKSLGALLVLLCEGEE